MKKTTLLALLACFASSGFSQNKKALYVIVDGIPTDVIKKLASPNIYALTKKGAFLNSYQGGELNEFNQTPTISAPGYNNILTGVWFHKHNVPDNDIKAPNYHYPSIFRLFKDQYPDKKIAIFSTWQDNRTKLVGEGLPQTNHIKFDDSLDGLELDEEKYPHDNAKNYIKNIDQAVTDEASKVILEKGPDLSWVYLQHTDDIGHLFGDSEAFNKAVKEADSCIGQLWAAVKKRKEKYKEDWLVIITTDHGRDSKTGKDHGGQSDRERATWTAINLPVNNYAKNATQVAAVDILPTIARFLNVNLSENRQYELDGVPLIGKVSVSNPAFEQKDQRFTLTWTPEDTEGNVKIWISEANNYKKTGKPDTYRLIGETPVKDGKFEVDLSGQKLAGFYKFVIEGKYNMVNRWFIKQK